MLSIYSYIVTVSIVLLSWFYLLLLTAFLFLFYKLISYSRFSISSAQILTSSFMFEWLAAIKNIRDFYILLYTITVWIRFAPFLCVLGYLVFLSLTFSVPCSFQFYRSSYCFTYALTKFSFFQSFPYKFLLIESKASLRSMKVRYSSSSHYILSSIILRKIMK